MVTAGARRCRGTEVKFAIAMALVALALAGCVSSEQVTQMQQEDDAACRNVPGREYNGCMRQRMAYRQLAVQQQAAAARDFGNRLQQAGAALQAASPPPSQTTQCQMLAGQLLCHTF
jgi:hypothetical protein